MLQLLERVIELENWTEGKGLIVHGAKNTFCSGSDLNAVKALSTPEASMWAVHRGCSRQKRLRKSCFNLGGGCYTSYSLIALKQWFLFYFL